MTDTRTIAIVDDHTMFRKGLITLINLFPNYSVLFDASNGEDCIKQLNPNILPDIVLIDISMPIMDGYETSEWVHRHYPDIKILALSTMDSETAIIKMIKSGARGYVLKDADPSELKYGFDEVMSQGYFYNELITRKVMKSVSALVDEKNSMSLFLKLTEREIEFLKFACSEMTYKEIAEKMFVSVRTVEGYRDALCLKLNLKTRVGLVTYAIKNQIINISEL